ncbi:MAG TPA: hypothetical protein VGI22_02595 [Xanthobacteraceae bacterium]
MRLRGLIGRLGLAFLLGGAAVAPGLAQSMFDQSQYPDWKGQWLRSGPGRGNPWDPTKPMGLGEGAPLTPEYQAIYEAALKDEANGGQGIDPTYLCVPSGMPRGMIVVLPMEIIVTPQTTYIQLELFGMRRRIYTDGRDWPAHLPRTFAGYSIGRWLDTTGSGRYDQLLVETRGIRGPHTYDSSGVPFHTDEQAIITERFYSDPRDPNLLHNEVTTLDHALTRPWTVTRTYHRDPSPQPLWTETFCTEDNHHVLIGGHNYIISGDGHLMPARKDQPPPDLRNFATGN